MALYIALQFLRTADYRDILCAFASEKADMPEEMPDKDRRGLHTTLLWDLDIVHSIRDRIRDSIWMFGKNDTDIPFVTSDNPVAFQIRNNRMWIKAGVLDRGTYVVFPLSPKFVMYCHEREYWAKMAPFDLALSPVVFTAPMVEHENSGQAFMATRFVISPVNDFAFVREFASTIGTDVYAPKTD